MEGAPVKESRDRVERALAVGLQAKCMCVVHLQASSLALLD